MKKKWIRRLCSAAAAGALLLSSAWAEEIPELLEPVGVKLATATVCTGSLSTLSTRSGSVVPYVEDMSFAIGGRIGEINAVVGQTVKAGDVLLTLDRESESERAESLSDEIAALKANLYYDEAIAQVDMDILELELEQLGAQLPRDERAIELKKLEMEEFDLNRRLESDLVRMELQQLEDQLAELESEASKSMLVAPFDGRVMFIAELHPGKNVAAYESLIYLADDSQLFIESDYISESTLRSVHDLYALVDGERVNLEPIAMDATDFISKALTGEKMVSRFQITSEAELSAGQYASVCIVTGYVEEALLIPSNALFFTTSGKYVYVVEDGVRIHRDVKTGSRNPRQTQILEGLEEGESVYVPD